MSSRHKVWDTSKGYFITMTIVDWIKVFESAEMTMILIRNIQYCQQFKGLEIFGYCIMPNHVHLIVRSGGSYNLSEIIRDLKKYSSRKIIEHLMETKTVQSTELLKKFSLAAHNSRRHTDHRVWQDGFHPKMITSPEFFYQKLGYIHENPVKAGMVEKPEEYHYSSAVNYSGGMGLIEIILETVELNPK